MKRSFLPFTLFALAAASPLNAADAPPPAPDVGARQAAVQKFVEGLQPKQGEITLRGGVAKINLPQGFHYLDAKDTETVLTKIWGNPAGGGTLGMITPAKFHPLANESWAVVLTFQEDGYVKDDDAAKIDYAALLKDMQEGTAEANKARQKEGYPAIELVGWAATPRYDAATHKMYWAKEIKFGDSPEHTLNYNIRMLGRRGVLVVNAVASMAQLKEVEAATPQLLGMLDFQDGHRYADFTEKTDKVATYGLAALVAGGIGAKAGLFKVLWLGILAFKKFVVIGIIALVAFVRKIFANRKEAAQLRSGETEFNPRQ
ncbi:MAG: DUF2167 domain-containing protein [Opitutaceae bacterium]